MTEKVFQAELAACFRAAGWWVAKWPDAAVSRMMAAKDGKLRFSLPKPCDLILCSPTGQFGAIECKLVKRPHFTMDERTVRQVETLAALPALAFTALALNFRYRRVRPKQQVNRAFLLDGGFFKRPAGRDLAVGETLRLDELTALVPPPGCRELARISGGWTLGADPACLVGEEIAK